MLGSPELRAIALTGWQRGMVVPRPRTPPRRPISRGDGEPNLPFFTLAPARALRHQIRGSPRCGIVTIIALVYSQSAKNYHYGCNGGSRGASNALAPRRKALEFNHGPRRISGFAIPGRVRGTSDTLAAKEDAGLRRRQIMTGRLDSETIAPIADEIQRRRVLVGRVGQEIVGACPVANGARPRTEVHWPSPACSQQLRPNGMPLAAQAQDR
jgi:hypothetical protein